MVVDIVTILSPRIWTLEFRKLNKRFGQISLLAKVLVRSLDASFVLIDFLSRMTFKSAAEFFLLGHSSRQIATEPCS